MISGGDIIRPQSLRLAAIPAGAGIGPAAGMPGLPGAAAGTLAGAGTAPTAGSSHVAVSASPFENIASQLDHLFSSPPPDLHARLEELIVTRAYSHAEQNQVRTAKLLGVSRNILRTLLKRYGLIRADTGCSDERDTPAGSYVRRIRTFRSDDRPVLDSPRQQTPYGCS